MNLRKWEPQMLGVLRIMTALLFGEHGLQKLINWPPSAHPMPSLPPLVLASGILESVGGVLLLLGLLTRPTAFILAGQMAVAYFLAHAPKGFFPVNNGGDDAILYCFIFLYFIFSGPGAFSLDALIFKPKRIHPEPR